MKTNAMIVLGLIFVIFFSGCVDDDVTGIVENLPQVQQFLEENP